MTMRWSRRDLLKIGGIGLTAGLTGGCDSAASVFGRLFAVPPRETTYFTQNDTFYVVNYSDSPFSLSRDVLADYDRGAVDSDLTPLDDAAHSIAIAENSVVFLTRVAAMSPGI